MSHIATPLGSKIVVVSIALFGACLCGCSLPVPTLATGASFTVDNTITVLEVSIPSSVYLDLSPTTGVKFNTQSLSVLVGTNNATGYTLTMQASSDILTRTSSITDSNNNVSTPTILPMLTTGSATGYTAAQFEDSSTDDYTLNRWGYKLSSDTNFVPMDTSSHVIASTNAPGNATATTLNFAAKVDTSTPSGTYATTISFTAVTNEVPIYMQDTASIAMALPNKGDSIYAYDARDGKKYKLAKLEDGKIWMVENLNLAGETKLYSETSDVPLGFPEFGGTGYYQLPASAIQNENDANLTDSTQFSDNSTAYVFNSGNNTATCDSSNPCNSYYSWLAATAGGKDSSGNAVTSDGYNAAYSICPKGWRLPTSTTSNAQANANNNWKTGDFYALATAYGADLESDYYVSSNAFYNNAGPNTTIPKFLLAGDYDSGSFYNGGGLSFYWSATSSSSTLAYSLVVRSGSVYSANSTLRRFGLSVRCLAKTLRTITVSYGANVTSVSVNGTTVNNGGTIKLSEGDTYTITATFADGYSAGNWSATSGTIANPTIVTTTYTVGASNATLAITAGPKIYMQDTEAVLSAVPNTNDAITVYDMRDNRAYNVAKLADGKVWMMSNLNLAGGTKLYSETSDVPSGYSELNEVPYYQLPASAIKNANDNGLTDSNQFTDNSVAYVFNSGNNTDNCNSTTPCNSYYSWIAATAGGKDSNNNAVTEDGYNAPYSICPKGWRLPTATTSNAQANVDGNWKTGDYYALAIAYGANLEYSHAQHDSDAFYINAGPGTLPDFLLSGYYSNGTVFSVGGSYGFYWSATSKSDTDVYSFGFTPADVYSANSYIRRVGFPIRCLLDN